jgi:lipopolysaccharide export system permease protein
MANKVHQRIDDETGDLYIVLTDGYRYVGTPGKKDYEIMKYDEYAIRIKKEINLTKTDASSASTTELWHNRDNRLSAAELQWRISLPLSAIILIAMGVPLSKIQPRHGRFVRLIPATLIYIIYVNLLVLARSWIRTGVISTNVGMWWVHIIMLMVAFILIFKQLSLRQKFLKK